MRAISVKKEYARDWERLMKLGAIETDGNTARYFSQVLSANGIKNGYECFRNSKTRCTIFRLNHCANHVHKKQYGWKRVKFYLS